LGRSPKVDGWMMLFLDSGEARYVTGVALPVDPGSCLK
jgi:hypothetical protein